MCNYQTYTDPHLVKGLSATEEHSRREATPIVVVGGTLNMPQIVALQCTVTICVKYLTAPSIVVLCPPSCSICYTDGKEMKVQKCHCT